MNYALIGEDAITKGQDWIIEHTILGPVSESLELTGAVEAGATTLYVKPLKADWQAGEKVQFEGSTVITLTVGASAGAVSVPVAAIPGPLPPAIRGRKLRDLTGYTLEYEVLATPAQETPIIASAELAITILDQTGNLRGKVRVQGPRATTIDLPAKRYFYALWRNNDGSRRPIAWGDWDLRERGFL